MSAISHPEHYNNGILPGECIDYVKYLDFCRGNIIKYLWRYKGKNGIEDMKKAAQYCDFITDSPDVVSGKIPDDLLQKLSDDCMSFLQDNGIPEEDTEKAQQDFIMFIHTLATLEEDDEDSIVIVTQMLSKIIAKHVDNYQ